MKHSSDSKRKNNSTVYFYSYILSCFLSKNNKNGSDNTIVYIIRAKGRRFCIQTTLTTFGIPTNNHGPSLIIQPTSPPRLTTPVDYKRKEKTKKGRKIQN